MHSAAMIVSFGQKRKDSLHGEQLHIAQQPTDVGCVGAIGAGQHGSP